MPMSHGEGLAPYANQMLGIPPKKILGILIRARDGRIDVGAMPISSRANLGPQLPLAIADPCLLSKLGSPWSARIIAFIVVVELPAFHFPSRAFYQPTVFQSHHTLVKDPPHCLPLGIKALFRAAHSRDGPSRGYKFSGIGIRGPHSGCRHRVLR